MTKRNQEPDRSMFRQILQGEKRLADSKVLVGFDGFIDILEKPIVKTTQKQVQYFRTIEEFGDYLSSHRGVSCSVEMQTISRKFGGNAPHLSNALSKLGASVDCVGTFGKKETDPVFSDFSFRLYSFDDAARSTALEFSDGKVMLGERVDKELDWDAVERCTAEAGIENLIRNADLMALVNWSEIGYSYDLWKKVLEYDQVNLNKESDEVSWQKARRWVLFDLCDISRKPKEEVLRVLELIREFSASRRTVLSLNRNETGLIRNIMGTGSDQDTAQKLREEYKIHKVIVHGQDENLIVSKKAVYRHRNSRVTDPAVLTGAGDNFNGACCAAILLGLREEDWLWFASKYAEEYVKNGISPTLDDMKCFAQEKEIVESRILL